jgi:hypothetical protein
VNYATCVGGKNLPQRESPLKVLTFDYRILARRRQPARVVDGILPKIEFRQRSPVRRTLTHGISIEKPLLASPQAQAGSLPRGSVRGYRSVDLMTVSRALQSAGFSP